ncbi:MAG: metallophosphoesterase family protein [Bacteriovoracaceae bacterium]
MKFILVLSLLLASVSALAEFKHLRVLMHSDPSHKAMVVYTLDNKQDAKGSELIYSINQKIDDKGVKNRVSKYSIKSLKRGGKHLLKFALNDLEAGSKVYFKVVTPQKESKEFYFKTAPKQKDAPLALLFGGDSRSDSKQRRIMNKKMKELVENNPEIVALVFGGDMIENGMSWSQWNQWLEDYQVSITDDNRVLPFVPVRGNHETDKKLFNQLFFMEEAGYKDVYYVSYFSDLAIINLNTNISHLGKQRKWLKKTLKELSAKDYWMVPNYHRPAFPAVKKSGKAKKHWVPLFEEYGVKFAFESDGHALKRTAPIYKGKINHDKGVVYLGEGGLGVKQRDPKRSNKWYFQSPGYAYSMHHIFLLKKENNTINVSVEVPNSAKAFDQIIFEKTVN